LSEAGYAELAEVNTRHGLDFDDAYQFAVARENKLAIATQDKDFQRVRNAMDVRLL
jgi:predicted nucleic acid-binding protein